MSNLMDFYTRCNILCTSIFNFLTVARRHKFHLKNVSNDVNFHVVAMLKYLFYKKCKI